ncbi:alpha/beta fold hydrolase [Actinoallomurus acaciae]|uniref:Alpha/beta fold hydrolase n=1 Tax=Actinoallomurus acaciae TaxID=502577 RepID=A0ABV5YC93_9ACTN
MNTPLTGTLKVPGATLHYETYGAGPVLLLIPGGAADAGLYAGMAADLAAHHTVVTYDPRGLSRSPLDAPLTDQKVDVWSDDARRLLDLLAPHEEASVLGCSSGAIVAVDLLARHPERLRRVVAHEPPLLGLLEDPAPHRALFAEVREVFRTEGAGAAMARFGEGLGGPPAERPAEPPPEIREMAPRMHANLPVFLGHMLVPFSSTVPDLAALGRVARKLVPAAGRDSRGQVPLHGPVARLADLLGSRLVEFPGGHLGAVESPQEFAKVLLEVLD